jgi:hypothetical protein
MNHVMVVQLLPGSNGLDEKGWPWFDLDGCLDDRGTRYVGRAHCRGEKFRCLAQVEGATREVEVTITIAGHDCGRDDCGRARDPERNSELYYARLVCGHGDWPCAQGCRRPVHPVERCPGSAVIAPAVVSKAAKRFRPLLHSEGVAAMRQTMFVQGFIEARAPGRPVDAAAIAAWDAVHREALMAYEVFEEGMTRVHAALVKRLEDKGTPS